MKIDPKVIQTLNTVLKNEVSAINQYFLHARICKNWGLAQLNDHEYEASIRAMKNADALMERILFLEGLPNLQDLSKLLIGENVQEILRGDHTLETAQRGDMVDAIAFCETQQDYVSRDMLDSMLEHKEEQIDWLETQQDLIAKIGIENYLQSTLS